MRETNDQSSTRTASEYQTNNDNVAILSYREGKALVRQLVRQAARNSAKQLVEQFEKNRQVCGNDLLKLGIQFSH